MPLHPSSHPTFSGGIILPHLFIRSFSQSLTHSVVRSVGRSVVRSVMITLCDVISLFNVPTSSDARSGHENKSNEHQR